MNDSTWDRRPPMWVISTTAAVVTLLLIYRLRAVVTPVFFAFMIAYVLDPVVDRLQARGLGRGFAIGALLLVGFVLVAGAIGIMAPFVHGDVSDFVERFPSMVQQTRGALEQFLSGWGVSMPNSLSEVAAKLQIDVREVLGRAAQPVSAILTWVLGGTFSVISAIAGAVVIPVMAFYLLYDFDDLIERAKSLVPNRMKPSVFSWVHDIDAVLSSFLRGQLIVMLILAVLYSVGYSIARVPLAIPIALVGGLVAFIPYIGGALALTLAVITSLLDWSGWLQILVVLAVYGVIQLIESFVVTPRVMEQNVGLSALSVLLALMAGGELLGFTGVLLAVPAAAVVKIAVGRGLVTYRSSKFFIRS